MTKRYVIAFYELNMAYGGGEEGGWYYTTGELVRPLAIARNEHEAYSKAERANRLLEWINKPKYPLHSVAYNGGKYRAMVHEGTAPTHFPANRPHYE